MTSDKEKLHSYNALEKEKNVSFGNDTLAVIKGKGSIFLGRGDGDRDEGDGAAERARGWQSGHDGVSFQKMRSSRPGAA